jgi:hypothetical protein
MTIKEVSLQNTTSEDLPKLGDLFSVDAVFKVGDIVDVTGTSKGKGFAGVVKRHNFRGGPKTHGQSDRERAPGSIGQTTTPGRVYRGKKMAGRMGSETKTITNLTVVDVDSVNKTLSVLGLVPGHKKSVFLITQKGTDKKFVPLLGFTASNAVGGEVEGDATSNVAVDSMVPEVVEVAEAVVTPEESVGDAVTEVATPSETVEVVAEEGEDEKIEENVKEVKEEEK